MTISKYRKEKIVELQKKSFELYKGGVLTTREIGKMIGKSYSWVSRAIKTIENNKRQ